MAKATRRTTKTQKVEKTPNEIINEILQTRFRLKFKNKK